MINVGAGIVDHDYRGEVAALIFNHSTKDSAIDVGDRTAQLNPVKTAMGTVVEDENLDGTRHQNGSSENSA